MPARSALALAVVLTLVLAGCSHDAKPSTATTTSGSTSAAPTSPGAPTAEATKGPPRLAAGTCWSGAHVGDDPQVVVKASTAYAVPYAVAATALADDPSFEKPIDCANPHAIEVYKFVRTPRLEARITSYAELLKTGAPLFREIRTRVTTACQAPALAASAKVTGFLGATMQPALPTGMHIGWAPLPPDRWQSSRSYACFLTQTEDSEIRFASIFTSAFPTSQRTCIDSKRLTYVDCARSHDRERFALIRLGAAVAAKQLPGREGVLLGPRGKRLDLTAEAFAKLDAGCAAYLRTIKVGKPRLLAVSQVDIDFWPAPDGTFSAFCEAGAAPGKPAVVTTGSTYTKVG